jgi:phage terminase large subunit-like protein
MTAAWDDYARRVVDGKIVTGRQVRAACARHLADLERDDLRFDAKRAEAVIWFFEHVLKHSKGEWSGQAITLQPWERFILASIFGWYQGATRRFRTAYIEVARKNGKTLLASGLGLYMMLLDNEGGAEVYSAATTREQARLSHGEAVRMVKQSSQLRRELGIVCIVRCATSCTLGRRGTCGTSCGRRREPVGNR